jgi:glycosyltransferase involved in cell wall biosynthesis
VNVLKLSLIVPCYNEEENVAAFQNAVISAFSGCGYRYEIIYIDDGSKDSTLTQLRKLYNAHMCPVKVVSFTRNFGKEAGIYAGLEHAQGDYIAVIDADLQQRPEIVRKMVEILDKQPEYDMVTAFQDRRSENKVLSFFKRCFYKLINGMSNVTLKADASDFRTFRKCVADSILSVKEYHRFSKGIFAWVGYDTEFIPYTACERAAGTTKWSFTKLMNYAIEGIIGFSTKPLRFATYLGGLTAFAALIYLIFVVIEKLVWKTTIPGYASTVVLILLLGGIQLICIGIIGEYVGKTFEQSKDRPIYLAKEVLTYEKDQ